MWMKRTFNDISWRFITTPVHVTIWACHVSPEISQLRVDIIIVYWEIGVTRRAPQEHTNSENLPFIKSKQLEKLCVPYLFVSFRIQILDWLHPIFTDIAAPLCLKIYCIRWWVMQKLPKDILANLIHRCFIFWTDSVATNRGWRRYF